MKEFHYNYQLPSLIKFGVNQIDQVEGQEHTERCIYNELSLLLPIKLGAKLTEEKDSTSSLVYD